MVTSSSKVRSNSLRSRSVVVGADHTRRKSRPSGKQALTLCIVQTARLLPLTPFHLGLGVDDDQYGQRLKVFVVAGKPAPSADELKEWVRQNLARYKVPREIVFLDELPRNATGKILKRDLAQLP